MAGHSKWANIKHSKAKQDAKRGKVFTKLIREITTAARIGGDISANPRLRAAVDKAYLNNMTKDTVDRAIKRGAGGDEGQELLEVRYEGYGPGGVAVLVDCLTDNKNRSVAEVRHAFSKCGGNLGTDGSVSYLFTKRGVITFAPGSKEESIMEIALEQGADDVVVNEDQSIDVFSEPDALENLQAIFKEKKVEFAAAEVSWVPANYIALRGEQAEQMQRLVDLLEDLDDVQNVYYNADQL